MSILPQFEARSDASPAALDAVRRAEQAVIEAAQMLDRHQVGEPAAAARSLRLDLKVLRAACQWLADLRAGRQRQTDRQMEG